LLGSRKVKVPIQYNTIQPTLFIEGKKHETVYTDIGISNMILAYGYWILAYDMILAYDIGI
jgi:hypothetical protein